MGANTLSDENIQSTVSALIAAFRKTRVLITRSAGDIEYSTKADGSPVTNIDFVVEKILKKEMAFSSPEIPFFGEEAGYKVDALPNICWLVDPIDGTKSFINSKPYFTCMGVLLSNHEAVACVIYNPTKDDVYTAFKGGGAYKNNSLLDLRSVDMPDKIWCKQKHIQVLNELLSEESIISEHAPDGAGYGFAMVAEGKIAGRVQMHSKGYVHDYAPGALLVREAHGDIIPIKTDDYNFKTKSFVACHPKLGELVRSKIGVLRSIENNIENK